VCGVPIAPMTSGAQPCTPAAPFGAEEASTSLRDDHRPDQGDLLSHEAANGKAQQIHRAELHGGDERGGVAAICSMASS
jgi:hypothetical protein